MPRRAYVEDETGRFVQVRNLVQHLTAPGEPTASVEGARPNSRLITYRGRSFSLGYPENWQVHAERQSDNVTIVAPEGMVDGKNQIGYGMEAGYYAPAGAGADLNRDTEALVHRLKQANSGMRTGRDPRSIQVGGQAALLTTLNAPSPYRGEQEVDALVTVARPDGLFYAIFIAPQREFNLVQEIFENVLRSVQFF